MLTTLEERVAYLEGKLEEHSGAWEDLKDMIIHLENRINALDQKIDRRVDSLYNRINALDQKIDRRVDSLDNRIDSLDNRINAFDSRINALDNRIGGLDQKISKYFIWMIGIQVTIFLSIIATLLR